jgi:hypothetical protein
MSTKARLKKIAIISLGTIVGVFLLLFILLQVFAGDIGETVLRELQAQTTTKVEAGDISISMFPYFPSAAIKLKDMYIENPKGDTLLAAEDIAFKISIFNLIRSKIDIRTLRVKNGYIFIEKYPDGSWSYDIFKSKDTTANDQAMSISIREAYLDRTELKYKDWTQKQDFSTFLLKAQVDLAYGEEQLEIMASYQSIVDYFGIDSTFMFQNKAFEGDLHIHADLLKQVYSFNKANMTLAGNPVDLKGQITLEEKATLIDLQFEGLDGTLENAISILPEPTYTFYQQFSPEGKLNFNGSIVGTSSTKSQPVITFNASLSDGSLSSRKLDTHAKNIEANVKLEQKSNQSSFTFEVLQGTIQDEPFNTKIDYQWGRQNAINVSMNGHLPAALIFGSGTGELLERCSGTVEFNNISVRGNPRQASSLVSKGSILAEDIDGRLDGSSFELNKIDIALSSDKFSVNALEWNGFGTELSGNGQINNYLSLISPDPKLIPGITLQLKIEEINIDEWLAISKKISSQEVLDSTLEIATKVPDWYDWNADYDIDIYNLKYEKWNIDHVKGVITVNNNKMHGDVLMEAFDGKMESKFDYNLHLEPSISGTLETEKINIKTFFEQSDNFGQEFLTSDNLSGSLDSKMTFEAFWDASGILQEKKLKMDIAAMIEDGELKDLKMLEDFSKFVKIDDLRRIKFTSLHNLLEIRDGAVILPAMFIQSNALNLTINGLHKFNQDVDYHMMINAGQVLVNKFKKYNPDLDPIPARQNGLFNIHYRLFGPLANIKYKANRKAVLDAFQDGDRQRDQIRNRLVQRFGPSTILFDSSVKNLGEELDELNTEDGEPEYLDFE